MEPATIRDGNECITCVADACGDVSEEAHERAMERMGQAGVRPMTSLQYLLELQRDWARSETYGAVTALAKELGGAYGLGISYAKAMFGGQENEQVTGEGLVATREAVRG